MRMRRNKRFVQIYGWSNVSKMIYKSHVSGFSLNDALGLGRIFEVKSEQRKALYDNQRCSAQEIN